ncbi:His-Xaa-Ser system radical SAM maturase HxsC [Dyadobacter crusticola]|uniref:His-Xaa-Ser system radical SAM maturase HxsC n=1 Tax=Dyadobacter crusticola TaxID=292407 RepID=UPI00196A12D6|nr:His-Xaa-Ser system radical SAM maturase HxsC [Dyadobacter crusticola]
MMELRSKGKPLSFTQPIIGRITYGLAAESSILIDHSLDNTDVSDRHLAVLTKRSVTTHLSPIIHSIPSIQPLSEGDVIMMLPNGIIQTLFRVNSLDNTLFTTDRCNSNCLMCSQPPKDIDDIEYYYNVNHQVISLIPPTTEIIGITGGEPTLMGKRFFDMISHINRKLPATTIHILTNGRSFAWKNFTARFESVNSSNLVLGIPLYSDYYVDHDYIVQASHAFNQTVLGLQNLASIGARIELRVVLHKLTFKRLPELAKFIFLNLPFVEQVAFMGLEYTGYTPHNDKLLWIDPLEYADELNIAVTYLNNNGINVSIYNHPLCLLPKSMWRFSVKSISDWKRHFLPECDRCLVKADCGGIFATSRKVSLNINPQ